MDTQRNLIQTLDTSKKPKYKGRFAPSPTGPLHFGSLYTAVASYLQAKASDGTWLLRIDDLDSQRCQQKYSDLILKTLEKFGLEWDGSVFYQHSRATAYQEALDLLKSKNLIYPCSCSRKQLQRRNTSEHSLIYDQYCLQHPPSNTDTAQRLQLPQTKLSYNDLVQGIIQQDLRNTVGDFIVSRKDHIFAYHLAVVVDDEEQGITDILRGYDLMESTPRQILLQQLLGFTTPEYAHIPVISHSDGAKLSKQTFADDVSQLSAPNTLIRVLHFLNLKPPKELMKGTIKQILEWAIQHWTLSLIKKQASISLK